MIRTAFTRMFDLDYPIMLAPMAFASGGELAAAVSNEGGLGMVGGGYCDPVWLNKELAVVKAKCRRKWGVGLITWKATDEAVDLALSFQPDVFFLSFGDPGRFSKRILSTGCTLVCQVQDTDGAKQALDADAALLIAQGTEAGGHGASRATLPLVPAVIDVAGGVPVLAAGGIADGRGVAAALGLGAAGAVIGTRFCATDESLLHPSAKQRLVEARGGDTVRTHVFDEVRGYAWPAGFDGRALRNRFSQSWEGKNARQAEGEYQAAASAGNFDTAVVWAGEGVDLVTKVEPAAAVLRAIGVDAEARVRDLQNLIA